VAPWEVGELPQDFLETIEAIEQQLPIFAGARAQAQARVEKWRAELKGRMVH